MNKIPFIERGSSSGMDFGRRSRDNRPVYFFLLWAGSIFCVLVLLGRLFSLTIVQGEYYRRLSDENRIREILIDPHRGSILDRKGLVIVSNHDPDVNKQQVRITSRREYKDSEVASHLLGYRQLADADDMAKDACFSKLKSGSKVGKQGVEKLYECQLRGSYGKKLVEVDAQGKQKKVLTVIPPKPGQDIQLALDWDLQQKAYNLIRGKKAAVVALKPSTGEVLVVASSPSFSAQDFEDDNLSKINAYLKDKDQPLFNRALEGVYPPGSTFKTVIATGALEEKAIDEHTKFEDTGTIKAGPVTFGNWYFLEYGKKEGDVDIIKGIRRSNDIFFYHTGAKLGVTDIKKWAQRFGYGRKLDLGLPQSEGTIPSPFWKEEVIKEKWYLGDTYNLSIGQGFMQATPFQVAEATTPFANGGNLCTPQLLKGQKPQCKSLDISEKTLSLVREGMKEACSPGGTGWPLFGFRVPDLRNQKKDVVEKYQKAQSATEEARLISEFRIPTSGIQVACKTGTAESAQETSTTPHAWITTFAPYDKPEIVVTIMVEQGGQGSDIAGPIARDILKAYFQRSQ